MIVTIRSWYVDRSARERRLIALMLAIGFLLFVEATTLSHPGAEDASAHYLFNGQPFTAADWSAIESAPGVLREGMRATAWVCDDGVTPPVIDWQPPAA